MNFKDLLPRIVGDLPGCPDIAIVNALRDAAIEFCKETMVWKRTLAGVALVDGQRAYAIPVPTGARAVSVTSASVGATALQPKTSAQVRDLIPNWQVATAAVPNYFNCEGDSAKVQVFPLPMLAASAPLVMTVSLTPDLLAAQIDDTVANDHYEALLAGARYRLMLNKGRAWSDPQMASFYLGIFNAKKVDARIAALHDGVSSQLVATARPFGF